MTRRVFFSFHYQRYVWRTIQIRSIPIVIGCPAAGFQDTPLREEGKKNGHGDIAKIIGVTIYNTSTIIAFITNKISNNELTEYKIELSNARGNGLIGIQVRHLQNQKQEIDSLAVLQSFCLKMALMFANILPTKNLPTELRRLQSLPGNISNPRCGGDKQKGNPSPRSNYLSLLKVSAP